MDKDMITRREFVGVASAMIAGSALAADEVAQGRIETLQKVDPTDALEPRVRVWMPAGYNSESRTYPTLYMLDGQFAFASDSDGVNFATDRRLARLVAAGRVPPTLIVAIDNLEQYRFLQYMPQTIYDRAESGVREGVEREISRTGGRPLVSAAFVEFVTGRLKPLVDAKYRTAPTRLDTAIFGASMAGVMAGAIFVEGQQVFGRGACMSPNWPIYDKRMIDYPLLPVLWADYFSQLGAPAGRRLWLDHGTKMMDAGMAPHQAAIETRLARLGWRRHRNLEAHVYRGAGHAFAETAVQMDDLLAWLLA
jgi:predicted alpha/beta superfamily hydrolase